MHARKYKIEVYLEALGTSLVGANCDGWQNQVETVDAGRLP